MWLKPTVPAVFHVLVRKKKYAWNNWSVFAQSWMDQGATYCYWYLHFSDDDVLMPLQTLAAVALFSVHWAANSPKTLTSVSSFWGSLLHRSLGCICNGRQSQRRAPRPDSLLLTAWHRVCLEPLDTLSCSRPLGKTTDRPPDTPTCHCHLRRGAGDGEADFKA